MRLRFKPFAGLPRGGFKPHEPTQVPRDDADRNEKRDDAQDREAPPST